MRNAIKKLIARIKHKYIIIESDNVLDLPIKGECYLTDKCGMPIAHFIDGNMVSDHVPTTKEQGEAPTKIGA